MMDKSILQSEHSLSHILFLANFASDAVYQIGAPAGDIFHAPEHPSSDCALHFPSFIQLGTVTALPGVTKGETPL